MKTKQLVRVKAPVRGARIANTAGFATTLGPFEEADVPMVRLRRYLDAGCALVTSTPPSEPPKAGVELTAVVEAVKQLVEEGDPAKFTTAGEPRVSEVESLLGYGVTKDVVLAAFDEVMRESNGVEAD